MLEAFVAGSERHVGLIGKMLADIPDERLTEQPAGLPNHPAWQVGHLAIVRAFLAGLVGEKVDLPEEWNTLFGRGSQPSGDRRQYPSKEDLLAGLGRAQAAIARALSGCDARRLAAPSPESLRGMFPTAGDAIISLLGFHDGMHAGQISDWRRAQGYPRVM